ncbi:hypothetical protein KPA96_34785, partial [Burkholderia cenocepacia]|uniref:hypothetical protein n=1 Tax=Burkholderia cenocepacia TaxID=95486 RepID=UPI002861843F
NPVLTQKKMLTTQSWRQCKSTAGAQNLHPYVKTRSHALPFMGKVKQRDFSQHSCGLLHGNAVVLKPS